MNILSLILSPILLAGTPDCPDILSQLPVTNWTFSAGRSVYLRLPSNLRALAVESVKAWIKERKSPAGPDFLDRHQIAIPRMLKVLGQSSNEANEVVAERLLSFAHFADSLVKATESQRLDRPMLELPGFQYLDLAKPIREMDREDWDSVNSRLEELMKSLRSLHAERLRAIEESGITETLRVAHFRELIDSYPKVDPSVTDRDAYLESLDTAFWMAVHLQNSELAGKFFMHMLYAGQPALAARAAFYIRNESLLVVVALLALTDAMSPMEIRWTRDGQPLEIGIEALSGVSGNMRPVAKKILSHLADAMPKIYARQLSIPPPPDVIEHQEKKWIRRASQYAAGKTPPAFQDGFMLNIFSLNLKTRPPPDEFGFVTELGQNDRRILDGFRKHRRRDPDFIEKFEHRARAALWEENLKGHFAETVRYREAEASLSREVLEAMIKEDLYRGNGHSALQIIKVLALMEESRTP